MSKKKTVVALFGILIIASFLRLYHITTVPPGLYPDEAMEGNNALQALRTGDFQVFYPQNNGREGLFANIEAVFLKVINVREAWVLRLPCAIAGILTVLGIYFLLTELFSSEIGLMGAFFLATSFWDIMFSRIAFRAILTPLFAVWGLYLLLLALKYIRSHEHSITLATLAGIVYGLGFYTYIPYRVTPALVLFILFVFWYRIRKKGDHKEMKAFWRSTAIFLFTTILVFLPLGFYFATHPGSFSSRTSEISVFAAKSPLKELAINIGKTAAMFNIHGDNNWRQNYAGRPELFWPVGLLFLLGIGLSLWKIFRQKMTHWHAPETLGYWFLLILLVLAAAPVFISDEGIPHALRGILMIPAAMGLAAVGAVWLYKLLRRHMNHTVLNVAVGIFLALLVVEAYHTYFILWAQNPNVPGAFNQDYVDIGHALEALPNSTPKYIIVKAGGVDVDGWPTATQTVMFLTDTWMPAQQQAKNFHYIYPNQESEIPAGAYVTTID